MQTKGGAGQSGRINHVSVSTPIVLDDMPPTFTQNDGVYVPKVCTEVFRQISLRHTYRSQRTDFSDIIFGEFCRCGLLALNASPFLYHISAIVGISSEKHMIGVYTGRGVAFMTYQQSFGDRTETQFVGDSMCQVQLMRSSVSVACV